MPFYSVRTGYFKFTYAYFLLHDQGQEQKRRKGWILAFKLKIINVIQFLNVLLNVLCCE